jgi:hypothetical protein
MDVVLSEVTLLEANLLYLEHPIKSWIRRTMSQGVKQSNSSKSNGATTPKKKQLGKARIFSVLAIWTLCYRSEGMCDYSLFLLEPFLLPNLVSRFLLGGGLWYPQCHCIYYSALTVPHCVISNLEWNPSVVWFEFQIQTLFLIFKSSHIDTWIETPISCIQVSPAWSSATPSPPLASRICRWATARWRGLGIPCFGHSWAESPYGPDTPCRGAPVQQCTFSFILWIYSNLILNRVQTSEIHRKLNKFDKIINSFP